ncbi:hypothetical protein J3998_08405 [Thiomicrorhabdus sp. 6S2-11]|jgi:hypothetical protein|uniref:STAS domain-containing protein n=1 Tax=Thiomicrorhabdus marina TaxID=2818442 RepID=A0ABS3Q705_9GAMM|nr:hypothetical protein [Thiomicrorhabdus marina]MBO1927595.1 hypothetical protein [Thiomicrorhabdus marina]
MSLRFQILPSGQIKIEFPEMSDCPSLKNELKQFIQTNVTSNTTVQLDLNKVQSVFSLLIFCIMEVFAKVGDSRKVYVLNASDKVVDGMLFLRMDNYVTFETEFSFVESD